MDRAKRKRLFWMSDKLLILSQELEKWADFCDWKALVGTKLDQPWHEKPLDTQAFLELKAAYDVAGPVVAALGKMFRAFFAMPQPQRRSQQRAKGLFLCVTCSQSASRPWVTWELNGK